MLITVVYPNTRQHHKYSNTIGITRHNCFNIGGKTENGESNSWIIILCLSQMQPKVVTTVNIVLLLFEYIGCLGILYSL